MSANAEINRANAQNSTGPKTDEGRKKSSLNALRHGLTGQIVVMRSEDPDAYRNHLAAFKTDLQPKGSVEDHLVQSLADTAWRLNRVAALENNLLTLGAAHASEQIQQSLCIAALESQAKALSNLSMHSQRLSRQFERTVNQLRDIQKQRRDQETLAMNQAMDLLETAEKNGESYDPSRDGFVFSKSEIDAALHLRNRARRAQKASRTLLMQAA